MPGPIMTVCPIKSKTTISRRDCLLVARSRETQKSRAKSLSPGFLFLAQPPTGAYQYGFTVQ